MPPKTISASGTGRCRTPDRLTLRLGADLSDATVAHHRRPCRRRCERILARLIGQWLSERLGQPFIIDNRPGACGNIGTEVVVKAKL